ncbi:Uncharacterised protein [Sphingobacterium spiritivorum]|uniref:Uncharacterized protein n=1 Tax=Sphingobacterium spiritivorum TaxID=258 RepID=A0A380CRA1_SPHSI|nr:Uncharacterised protein [Sphingobacterium spiritivorum]
MILPIKPFDGQYCETTATGTLLRQLDIELSESGIYGFSFYRRTP